MSTTTVHEGATPLVVSSTSPTGSPGVWQRRIRWGAGCIVPFLLLGLWVVATRRGWIADQVLPAPGAVCAALWDAAQSGELWQNLCISLTRVVLGFAAGASAGFLLGLSMGLSPLCKDYLAPSFKAFAQVPVLGWLPFLMLLVGIDEALKVLLIAKAAMVPVTLNTLQGVEQVPQRYLEVAKVLRFNRWQSLTRVILPAALAPIWTGLRYGFTHAWLSLVVVELLASSEGLGYMMVYGRQLFQLEVVMAAVVVIGLLGYLLDKGLSITERHLLRWRKEGF